MRLIVEKLGPKGSSKQLGKDWREKAHINNEHEVVSNTFRLLQVDKPEDLNNPDCAENTQEISDTIISDLVKRKENRAVQDSRGSAPNGLRFI